jgi:hypothetical protein
MTGWRQHRVVAWQPRCLLTNVQKFASSLEQAAPWRIEGGQLIVGFFIERFWAARRIDLNKLHYAIHPWRKMIRKGSAPEGHDDLGATAVNLPASDLNDLPDRHRLIAPDVENPFQDEVCVQSGSAERGRVSSFKRQRQQGTRIEGSVVVGIARQDQAMAQGFCILGLRLSHARRVPRIVSEVKRWCI